MKNIKKFQDFINEKKSEFSKKELRSKYKEFAKIALEKINKELKEQGKGKIMLIDLTDSDIKNELNDKDKTIFIKISKDLDKIDGYKVDENFYDNFEDDDLDEKRNQIIHILISKYGYDKALANALSYKYEDIIDVNDDMEQVVLSIIEQEDQGYDIEEEEEEYSRANIANQIDIDESDFEDSSDLGNIADNITDDMETFEYTLDEVKELFNTYIENNDTSIYFTHSVGKDFEYNKEKTLFKKLIDYYSSFEEKFGYLDEFGTPMFNNILKDIIKKYLK